MQLIAMRDAMIATGLLLVAVYAGSARLEHFDPALSGYLAAVTVACFSVAYNVSGFWRRQPSALYGRTLLRALGRPLALLAVMRAGASDLVSQSFIRRRSRVRWLAHMCLAWGTLVAFAITVPLVCGWLHFEAERDGIYRVFVFSVPLLRFDVSGLLGWLIFHALSLAAVAVLLGGLGLGAMRLARRHEARAVSSFHLGPIALLLGVAATGLALPITGQMESQAWFRLAALAHEVAVIALLVTLPYGKLLHLFIRPLHMGVQLLRAQSASRARCAGCGDTLAPDEQLAALESVLLARGFRFAEHQRLCPGCRRRSLAARHSAILNGLFQPKPGAGR